MTAPHPIAQADSRSAAARVAALLLDPSLPLTRVRMNRVWAIVAAVVVIDALGMAAAGASMPVWPLVRYLGLIATLGGVAFIYEKLRPAPILSQFAEATAMLLALTGSMAVTSYLGQMMNLPLWDARLADFDRLVSFDLSAHLRFLHEHVIFARVLEVAYQSGLIQMALALLILSFARRFELLTEFMAVFAVAGAATVVIGSLMPSTSSLYFYNIPKALLPPLSDPAAGLMQVSDILQLRAGTLREIPFDRMNGLISFPSFHTTIGLALIWSARFSRSCLAVAVPLNCLLILATPSNGGHYVVDILGGAAIAIAAIALVAREKRAHLAVNAREAAPLATT